MICRVVSLLCITIAALGCSNAKQEDPPKGSAAPVADQKSVLTAEDAVVRFEVLNTKLDLPEMVFKDGRREKVRATQGRPGEPRSLQIEFRVTNLSKTKTLQHVPSESGKDDPTRLPTLTDDLGNECKNITGSTAYLESFGDGKIVGRNSGAIEPGKSMTDILFFEAPLEKAQLLTLKIPANSIGDETQQSFTLTIPTKTITKSSTEAAAPK